MRLASRFSATSTIPFHVGAASIATLCGRKPAIHGVLSVEAPLARGHESDIGGLPNADDQRVAASCELKASLLDRKLRKL
jgi:hypothetical protein